MIDKIKKWFFEGVIMKKVAGKFVKHVVGLLVAFVATLPFIADAGIEIDWKQFEAWAVVALTGLFGAAWNYIEHRFVKKK